MPQTVADLGKLIKKKYPEYNDIADDELGRKIQAKYPEYNDFIDVQGVNKLGGSLPSMPHAPIPAGLTGPSTPSSAAIPSITHQGSEQLWQGILGPGTPQARTSDVIEGLGKGVSPAAVFPLITNPLGTVAGAGLGALGGGAGWLGSMAAGASPDTARLVGDLSGLAAGGVGSRVKMPSGDLPEIPGILRFGIRMMPGGRKLLTGYDMAQKFMSPEEVTPKSYPPPPQRWPEPGTYGSTREAPRPSYPAPALTMPKPGTYGSTQPAPILPIKSAPIPPLRTPQPGEYGSTAPAPQPPVKKVPIPPITPMPKRATVPPAPIPPSVKAGPAPPTASMLTSQPVPDMTSIQAPLPNLKLQSPPSGFSLAQYGEVPEPQPVTVTPPPSQAAATAKPPEWTKAYNSIQNLVKDVTKKTGTDPNVFIRSMAKKWYDTEDLSQLSTNDLAELSKTLKAMSKLGK